MNRAFSKLEPEKRRRVLDAAMSEFASEGFEKASTNRIVEKAEIGKGMLFYYFKSKKALYDYLVEYALEFIHEEYLSKIDAAQADFIEKYRDAGKIKMEAQFKNPHVFNFLGKIVLNNENELSLKNSKKIKEYRKENMRKMFSNIDMSFFREDIPGEKIVKFIGWLMEGYQNEIMAKLKGADLEDVDFNPYWEEFHENLDLFKKIFYK